MSGCRPGRSRKVSDAWLGWLFRPRVCLVFEGLQVVEVADLPWPWNPFKCQHQGRLTELSDDLPEHERQARIGAAVKAMTADELAACHYHRCDWHFAAEAAIKCFEQRMSPGDRQVKELVHSRGRGDAELGAIAAFFVHPLSWSRDGGQVYNGQHRICALKAAKVPRCLVET